MTRNDALETMGFYRGQNPDAATLKARYHAKAKECHPDSGGSRDRFESLNAAYAFLKDPPLEPSIKAQLERGLKAHKAALEQISVTTKLWREDDSRIPQMRRTHEEQIAEIEKRLGKVTSGG